MSVHLSVHRRVPPYRALWPCPLPLYKTQAPPSLYTVTDLLCTWPSSGPLCTMTSPLSVHGPGLHCTGLRPLPPTCSKFFNLDLTLLGLLMFKLVHYGACVQYGNVSFRLKLALKKASEFLLFAHNS